MIRAALAGVLLLAAGCASAPRPGPTPDGLAVAVTAREKAAARRQAVESLLPLFLTPEARSGKSAALDAAVFSKLKTFIGREKLSKKGMGVVEVKVDPLAAALLQAGLVRPPGYSSGVELVLLAFGNRAVGPSPIERFAADAFEVALFGQGIQAQDADDQIVQLKHPITAKTELGTVAQAAAGGWPWMVAGRVANVAREEPQSSSYRGRSRLYLSLYGADASTVPVRIDADGEALDVSTGAAVSHAIEQAAQVGAAQVRDLMTRKRAGHAIIEFVVSSYPDPGILRRVLADLRVLPGIEGATLAAWHGIDDMPLIDAFATGLAADALAGKMINSDPKLRIVGIESEDNRITVQGPDIPESADTGQGGN